MAVWVVRAGYYGDEEPIALSNNLATIHWNELDDLSKVANKDELANLYREANPDETNARKIAAGVRQVWAFRSEIKMPDLVLIPLVRMDGLAAAIGGVIGGYGYRKDLGKDVRHTLPVEWLIRDLPRSRLDADLSAALGHPPTVYRIQTPADAEQRFRRIVRDEIDRRYRRVCNRTPAFEANIIHKDSANPVTVYPVTLDALPREGEFLRLHPKGGAEALCFKVDYVAHDIGEERAHSAEVYVSKGDEQEASGIPTMLEVIRAEARKKRESEPVPAASSAAGGRNDLTGDGHDVDGEAGPHAGSMV